MKAVFEEAIKGGSYDLTKMIARIDYHHVRGNLTDEERETLIEEAREKAQPFGGLNVEAKLQEFERRIAALEEGNKTDADTGSAAPDYVPGKWYHNGNAVTFKGETFVCIAPDGVVCTWSPEEYPAYWERE